MQSPINPSKLTTKRKRHSKMVQKPNARSTQQQQQQKGTNPHLDLNTQVQNQLQKSPRPKENPAHLN